MKSFISKVFLVGIIFLSASISYAIPTQAMSSNLGQSIIQSGTKYLGVAYQYGANPDSITSFDCSSFTRRIFLENGIYLPRTSELQSTLGYEIPLEQAEVGDLVFFKSLGSLEVDHVGVYAGNMQMLNATTTKGVKYTDFSTSYWQTRFVSVRHVIPKTYNVQYGDVLWKIAVNNNASISDLIKWNNIQNDNIIAGQSLFIVNPNLTISSSSISKAKAYIVQLGDTLWIISQKTGTSISDIQTWNQLKSDTIYVGQQLLLEPPYTNYTVISGDSLWKISNKLGVTIHDIETTNQLSSDYIVVGQILKIPNF